MTLLTLSKKLDAHREVVHNGGYLSIVLAVSIYHAASVQSLGGTGVCERSPGAYLAYGRMMTLVTPKNAKGKDQTISFSFLTNPHFS